jgi:hypothetical protein
MPDAARLVAALCLAVLGYAVSEMIKPLMEEGRNFGWFSFINAGIGAVMGWTWVGRHAGKEGITPAINNGLTGVALLVFWGLFVQGCYEMVRLAMRNRYDGPFEAIIAIFDIGYEYSLILVNGPIIAVLLVGSVLTGLLTEYAWRTWR